MMNGAIVLCKKIRQGDYGERGVFNLEGIRFALNQGETEVLDVYAYFSLEKLGSHAIEIRGVHLATGTTALFQYMDREIEEKDFKLGMCIVIAPKIPFRFDRVGRWSLDLAVNGIIYATLPIGVLP